MNESSKLNQSIKINLCSEIKLYLMRILESHNFHISSDFLYNKDS